MGFVISEAGTTNRRELKGPTVWDYVLQGRRGPFLTPFPVQQDEDISQHSAFLSYCFMSPQFCFLYPEMVDKLILLENLGFLLAPEVRFHMYFPSLFKIKSRCLDFFFSFFHLLRESTDVTSS